MSLVRGGILFIATLLVLYANAQKVPVQYFFTETDARGYDGTYKAYVVKLFADSTIELKVYSLPGMAYRPPFYKTSYFGKYSSVNDSSRIKYWSSYSESRDCTFQRMHRPVARNNITAKTPYTIYPDLLFVVKDGYFIMSGLMIPVLPASSAASVNAIEKIFQQWGNPLKQNSKFTGVL